MKTIRQYAMIKKGDIVASALSGGKDSMSLLLILNNFLRERNIEFFALTIDEGIEGYRDSTIEDATTFCKKHDIPLKIISFQKTLGFTLDAFLKKKKMNPCTPCGTFRRYLLNKGARDFKATKLATGHNLDDEAQSIFMNQIKGNLALSAKLGPITGILMHKRFIPRIKPLYFMTEKEVTIYSLVKQLPIKYNECPNFVDTFRENVGRTLNDLEQKYPGTKQGIVNAFLELLPELRKKYQRTTGEIGTCKKCQEPAAKDLCKVCELISSE